MAPLSRGLELLDSAVSYALAGAAPGTAQLLRRPTPCPGWDLGHCWTMSATRSGCCTRR